MPDITLTIPAAVVSRVKAMVQNQAPSLLPATSLPQIPEGSMKDPATWTNAEALAVYKEMLRTYTLNLVRNFEAQQAMTMAVQQAQQKTDSEVVIT